MAKASQLSADERLALILESFRQEHSIADLCRKHGITQTTFYKWRDRFLAGGKRALMENGQLSNTADKAKIEELERVIGKQTVEIQVLKKNLNLR
jgi:transposase-like protein